MSKMIEAALEYANKTWYVFPVWWIADDGSCACGKPDCGAAGKHPITKNGFKDATIDAATLVRWWEEHPKANIGLRTGGSLVVVDVDPRNGGEQSFEKLEREYGELPATLTQRTGGGGFHKFFKADRLPCSRKLGRGIDFKGEGGYVLLPPSNHKSGGTYEWDSILGAVEPAMLPPSVSAMLKGSSPLIAKHYELKTKVQDGARDETLYSTARRMRVQEGLTEPEIWAALVIVNRDRCEPPLQESQLRKIVVSACKEEPKRSVFDGIETSPPSPWENDLEFSIDKAGAKRYKPCVANLILILENDETWSGKLAFNELSSSFTVSGTPWNPAKRPRPWKEEDSTRLRAWLQQRANRYGIDPNPRDVDAAVSVVCKNHAFHPVRDYLNSLVWDGVQRLPRVLHTFFGAVDSPYTQAVGLRWFIGAAARALEPGCKMDTTLVLEGPQGLGKSTALRVLAGDEWFTDSHLELGERDSYMVIGGKWIVELSELESYNRQEVSRQKSFLSSTQDHYRAPYAKASEDHPRQCAIVGTTNRIDYLRDETGGRRWWPVWCTKIHVESIAYCRDQLWAEAVSYYNGGHPWHLESYELEQIAAVEQDKRFMGDPWEEAIIRWAHIGTPDPKPYLLTFEALNIGVGMDKSRIDRSAQLRMSAVFKRIGYGRRERLPGNDGRLYAYYPSDEKKR